MRVYVATAAVILMSAGCWRSAGTARSAPSAGANLVTLRMTSPTTGWAVGTTGLLSTTDGGVHWQMATPLALGRPLRRSSYGLLTAFLDEAHAWIGVDNSTISSARQQSKPPTTLRLSRTADGGRHWNALPPLRLGAFYYAHTLTFINRETGWLQIIRNVAAGSLWFDLYRTLDGGGHWRRVLQVGSPHSLPGAPLGCDLCDSNLTFSSRTTVWFTGCWCGVGTGSSFLFVSRNAGGTWTTVALFQPPQRGKATIATLPPTLFDPRNGVLPTVVLGSNPGKSGRTSDSFDAYVTHDGGRHWSPTTPVSISRPEGYPAFPYSFPDARHGFFVSGKRLYRTSDGGKHWQARAIAIPLERAGSVQFLDGRRGWALRPGDTQGRRSMLWQTADGGETWKVMSTKMSRVALSVHTPTSISCAASKGACPTHLSLGHQYWSHVSWCAASDVRVAAHWQGENTTKIGGVSFSSRAASICTLQGRPQLALYSDGHRLNVRQKPGASLNNHQLFMENLKTRDTHALTPPGQVNFEPFIVGNIAVWVHGSISLGHSHGLVVANLATGRRVALKHSSSQLPQIAAGRYVVFVPDYPTPYPQGTVQVYDVLTGQRRTISSGPDASGFVPNWTVNAGGSAALVRMDKPCSASNNVCPTYFVLISLGPA